MTKHIYIKLYNRKNEQILEKILDKDSFIPRVGDAYYIVLDEEVLGLYVHYGKVTEVIAEHYVSSKNENIIIKVKEQV